MRADNDNERTLPPLDTHAAERQAFDTDASNAYWQNARDFYSITTNNTVDHLRVADYAHDLINSMVRLARVRGIDLKEPSL